MRESVEPGPSGKRGYGVIAVSEGAGTMPPTITFSVISSVPEPNDG